MWTCLLGPLLALLPKKWRHAMPFSGRISWKAATVISGLAEMLVGLAVVSRWYSYEMTAWVSHDVDAALTGKLGPGATVQGIGFVALLVWATQPLTWLLLYISIEGAARLCAALGDAYLGILPLFLLDRLSSLAFQTGRRGAPQSPENRSSFASALRERILVARLPQVFDEICFSGIGPDQILEIRASRRKKDWVPPRVVRYEDVFYRLESDSLGAAPRPFQYILRRLSAGVAGRTVLLYSPEQIVLRKQ